MSKIDYVEGFAIITELATEHLEEAQPLDCYFRMECKSEKDMLEKAKLAEQIAIDNGYKTYMIRKHIHRHPTSKCEVGKIKEVIDGVVVKEEKID